MEDDRAATNLGPSTEDEIPEEPVVVPKLPKRRFVGRKTAETASKSLDPNANIEDSSAIQGVRHPAMILFVRSED
jgi:2-(3-amino-3-carboxypropyl)histidine synthase